MPTKHSDAQPVVNLKEENQTWSNVMQQPMDSYFCGINTRSESSYEVRKFFHFVKFTCPIIKMYQNP